jgi:predicted transcriptional regulator
VLEADIKTTKNLPANTAPKYIPIEDILEYHKRGLTQRDIATLLGITQQSVQERLKNANVEGLSRFQDHKDKVFEHKQREIIDSLSGSDIKDMSGLQKITGAAILQDKIMALRGQASTIIEHRSIIADLRDAQDRLRKAGVVIDIEHNDS